MSSCLFHVCTGTGLKRRAIGEKGLHMIISGIDVSRICSQKVIKIDITKFQITLPFDKQSQNEIRFILDFSEILSSWSLFSAETLGRSFWACLAKDSLPFNSLDGSSVSRAVGFRPHGLRAIKAISLTCLGLEDQAIMDVIGWRQASSLELYRRAPRSEILKGGNLDAVLDMIKDY